MESTYVAGIERAWKQALDGKSPNNACAHLISKAVEQARADATKQPAAAHAYQTCYVDVRIRYLQTQLTDKPPPSCNSLMVFFRSGRSTLGSFAKDVGLRLEDLEARIAEHIGDRLSVACPNMAKLAFQQHTGLAGVQRPEPGAGTQSLVK